MKGYITDAENVFMETMEVDEAKQYCNANAKCKGFTFAGPEERPEDEVTITFKAGSKVRHDTLALALTVTLTLTLTLTLNLNLIPALTPTPTPNPNPKVTHDASGQWISFVKESSMDSVFGALHGAITPWSGLG